MYSIYKITNIVNNKIYIGKTINDIQKRFERHIHEAMNYTLDTYFSRAIRKYGKDNFYIEQIDIANTEEELSQKEIYWIWYYKSSNTEYGYNSTNGGDGGNTYLNKTEEELDEIRKKIKNTKIRDKNPNSKKVKCKNINTNEELHFNTMIDCQEYFNEKHHSFISRRCRGKIKCLFKNEWIFAYEDKDYSY